MPPLQVQAASERYWTQLGRHNYVTLTSYLQLLSAFRSMLETKRAANTAARKRYTIGLEKLASSASQVAGMQAELVAMQPQLVATVAEVEELMTRIAQEKKVGKLQTSLFGTSIGLNFDFVSAEWFCPHDRQHATSGLLDRCCGKYGHTNSMHSSSSI